ncbi:hypothetical protein BGX38DRAFT_755632 [Terfezia claveryi]|nr:hypothetical protein BGX38DRAFT_755632 [Terfezia claveryi]
MADQVPASQTAPIDEFRILWTSQKKQKLKKWQDGLLRFHTYNKRMIVYDETRALVVRPSPGHHLGLHGFCLQNLLVYHECRRGVV